VLMNVFIPLYCSKCRSQNNHTDNSYPAENVCAVTTICNECGHEKVTSVMHTTVSPGNEVQYAEQFQPERAF
jgi:hypothetical protein